MLDEKNEAKETELNRPFFAQAFQEITPYIKIGKVKLYTESHLDNGMTVVYSEGHTPGHVFYKVTSEGRLLFIFGDVLHVGDVKLKSPGVAIRFDTAPKEATQTRIRYFQHFCYRR